MGIKNIPTLQDHVVSHLGLIARHENGVSRNMT